MKNIKKLPELNHASGVTMHLSDGSILIDGICSWWSAIHGYNHEEINKAIYTQVQKFSHIMMGGISHQPAEKLAKKLVEITPYGLNHVFFSDSGSIGVEVALKIAIQYWQNIGVSGKNRIVHLVNGYHGDTFKAMEASDDSDFTKAFATVLSKQFAVNIPKGGFYANDELVFEAVNEVAELFENHHAEIACFIVEPIVQCAGGFHIYSPKYLREIKSLCEKYQIIFIADEVATGFGRTSKLFACEHADITPDIMILGKALTAGYIGHAATLVTSDIYNAFMGENYDKALMHGPTFMGNALACSIALKGIEIFEKENYLDKISKISLQLNNISKTFDFRELKQIRQIGAILAFEFHDEYYLKGFHQYAIQQGVWLRPIGKVVYVMPAYVIDENSLEKLSKVIYTWIDQKKYLS